MEEDLTDSALLAAGPVTRSLLSWMLEADLGVDVSLMSESMENLILVLAMGPLALVVREGVELDIEADIEVEAGQIVEDAL